MEFNDGAPQYELMAHHTEEDGVVKRKKLWRVFWIMLAITIAELIVGFNQKAWHLTTPEGTTSLGLKFFFVFFTVAKAAFIVLSFMHLGDEKKALKYTILTPYCLFVLYLVWIVTTEGTYAMDYREQMDKNILEQRDKLKSGLPEEHESAATEEETHSEAGRKEESHH